MTDPEPHNQAPAPAVWWTITEAANALGLHRQTVWAAIQRRQRGAPGLRARSRRLPGSVGRVWLIHRDEVAAYRARLTTRVAKPGPRPRKDT